MTGRCHISAELFRRFLDQRVASSERRAVVRHLIAQCPECLERMSGIAAEGGYWFGEDVASGLAEVENGEAAFEALVHFTDRETGEATFERLRGAGQWSALERLLPEERLSAIVEHREYQHWGLFQALLDAARAYSFGDPREAVDIAQLALEIADLLDPAEVGGVPAATDLQARAWAILGNAQRLASNLLGAREAIDEAWRLNAEGAGDPLDRAQIYSFDASYARTIGEFETAESILEQARALYLAAGDTHLQGRTLLQMGDAIGHVDPDRGIAHIERALELINPVREPRLELCAQHDLAWFLTDAGRPRDALAVLHRARPLYQQFADDWAQDRRRWLQGRIARACEQRAEAIHLFRQVYDDFAAQGRHMDLLMVSIDLAEAHVAVGEIATAGRLLAEVTPIMTAWRLHRNAMAAWLMFQQALEEQVQAGATARTLFARIRLYYLRYWHVPQAEFKAE
jgi:tetratricopeptide (TPR) repeat protein